MDSYKVTELDNEKDAKEALALENLRRNGAGQEVPFNIVAELLNMTQETKDSYLKDGKYPSKMLIYNYPDNKLIPVYDTN